MKTMHLGLVALLAVTATQALALPDVVTYAARIENGAGPFDGTLTATFELFATKIAGERLWSESVASVIVVDGDLVHDLGSSEPLDDNVLERDDLFLSVTINGETLEPRVALRAVPYALKAREAQSLAGLSASDVATDAEVAAAVAARVVAFAQLQGVPAGFADGVDNDSISTAVAGGGLKVAANAFSIEDNGVTLARMADNSVGSAEVAADSLGQADLGPGSVGNSELGDRAVTDDKISTFAVTTSKLARDSVVASKLLGDEVPLFARKSVCTAPGGVSMSPTCQTTGCVLGLTSAFLDCAGVCRRTSPDTCENDKVGLLLAPTFN